MRRTPSPELSRSLQSRNKRNRGSNATVSCYYEEALVEQVGTTVVHPWEAGRRAWRPQPSLDPNDPLVRLRNGSVSLLMDSQNWSNRQKYSTYLTACFFTFLATVNATKFANSIGPLSDEFEKTKFEANYLICFNVLLLGVGNIFWVPLMRVVGKRPVFLISLPVLAGANVWGSRTDNFNSFLASQIISGFAASAAEAIVPVIAADLFFVHQRGTVLMFFAMSLSLGAYLGPLINSCIVRKLSNLNKFPALAYSG